MKTMKKKSLLLIVSALVAALLLAACGRPKFSALGESAAQAPESYTATEEMADGAWREDAWEDIDGEASEAAYTEPATTDAGGSGELNIKEDKLVHTCHLEIQTLQYGDDAAAVREMVKKYNGIIESESETNDGYSWNDLYWYGEDGDDNRNRMDLYLTVRIPTDAYEGFLEEIGGVGKVISRTQNTDNISRAYYDTETHIKALEVEEERLLTMMESAETIEEMILVEERLTQVQNDLNSEKSWLADMNTDVAYSTVTINLREVLQYSNEGPGYTEPGFGERVRESFREAWSGFLAVLEGILHVIIHLWPFLLIGLVVLILVIRKVKKNRKAKAVMANGGL